MPVFKNEDNGTWYVMARYVNWKGERKQKCKRCISGYGCSEESKTNTVFFGSQFTIIYARLVGYEVF